MNRNFWKDQLTQFENLPQDKLLSLQTQPEKLIMAPMFSLPRSTHIYMLGTDGCDLQIGWVLLQQQPEGSDKLIGYLSRYLNDK